MSDDGPKSRKALEKALVEAQRAVTERPGDPAAQEQYRASVREARSFADWDVDAPDVGDAFERARRKPTKKERKATAKRQYNPPAPAPAGLGAQEAKPKQVSPYLREEGIDHERDARIRKHLASMLAKREFNRAVRNTQER